MLWSHWLLARALETGCTKKDECMWLFDKICTAATSEAVLMLRWRRSTQFVSFWMCMTAETCSWQLYECPPVWQSKPTHYLCSCGFCGFGKICRACQQICRACQQDYEIRLMTTCSWKCVHIRWCPAGYITISRLLGWMVSSLEHVSSACNCNSLSPYNMEYNLYLMLWFEYTEDTYDSKNVCNICMQASSDVLLQGWFQGRQDCGAANAWAS